jgi:3-phosphoshikimate 1-carboxyvinyltransferase
VATRQGPRRRVAPVTGPFAVTLHLPGSKSIANRALVCAALASGRSTLANLPDGDDTIAMIDALRRLGIGVEVAGPAATVEGGRGHLASGPLTLDAHLAGTTSRFLTAVAVLGPGPYRIDGAPPLRARPMAPLHDALATLGARVTPLAEAGHLPVEIERAAVRGGALALPGDVSSQFVTALMLVGPLLSGGLDVRLTTRLVSRPYVELTAAVMRAFGIDRVEVGDERVRVPPGAYQPATLTIEPDASSASYFAAAAATGPPGSVVRLAGLGDDSAQADARFLDVLAAMGAEVERKRSVTAVRRGTELRGVDVDLSACSDAVPTLGVVAALADGPTRIRGVGFVRAKESDRIGALATELRRCGVLVDEHADGLTIRPADVHGATVRTYDDHRMAMAFAVLGLSVPGIVVEDPAVVAKSYPGFWDDLTAVRRAVGSTLR